LSLALELEVVLCVVEFADNDVEFDSMLFVATRRLKKKPTNRRGPMTNDEAGVRVFVLGRERMDDGRRRPGVSGCRLFVLV
jgi:hypothetical protein